MLHSQIATASDLTLLRNSVSRPKEEILQYDALDPCYETPLCQELRARFGEHVALRKHFIYAQRASSSLGQWCADRIWLLATTDDEFSKLERKTEKTIMKDRDDMPVAILDENLRQLKAFKEVIDKCSFGVPRFEGNIVSSKARTLIEYMNKTFMEEKRLKGMIFVQQRWTAILLQDLLRHLGTRHIRPDLLIGSGTSEAGDLKVTFRKQLGALNRFRKSEVNCLIVTSIAEEGLDVPDCNLIIRFDLYNTVIQYIQSRGRARHMESTYVHMIEYGNLIHRQRLKDVRMAEAKTRAFCEALPRDRILQGNGLNPDFANATHKERGYRRYIDPETQATLTYASSLVFLAHFVATLPSNGADILQPMYHISSDQDMFICEVLLPESAPIHSATGQPAFKKSIARRSAAFEACLILRQKGFIDSHFISTYHKTLPLMRNARLAFTTHKCKGYSMKIKPDCWSLDQGSVPETLFVSILELEDPQMLSVDCQPLAILTRTKLPQFPSFALKLGLNVSSHLNSHLRTDSLRADESKLRKIDDFTLRIFQDVFNKKFESQAKRMSYWLAPVLPNWRSQEDDMFIDWHVIDEVTHSQGISWNVQDSPEKYVNRYLIDRWNGGQRYYSISVEPNMRGNDPVPPEATTHRFMDSVINYTVSLFSKSRNRATWTEEQPVLRAHQLLHRLNWLDDFTESEHSVNTKAWVCIEPLQISAVSKSASEMSLC